MASIIVIKNTEIYIRYVAYIQNHGIVISPAYLSQQWTGGYDWAHEEKSNLYYQGILESDYVQIDDTSARVNGDNHYCQVVCNPLFTAYLPPRRKIDYQY